MILQDAGPVLGHVLFQYPPEFRYSADAVGIQLFEEPLPAHQHRLEIEKLERQFVTCTDTIAVIC